MQLGSMLFFAAVLGVTCLCTTAHADDEGSEPDEDAEKTEPSEAEKHAAEDDTSEERAERAPAEAPRFEFALTATLASYSKLSYTLDIPVVGKVDGALSNTVFGPSANPVTLEVGYLLSSQFSLGLLLEAGSASTHTSIDPPVNAKETQTLGRLMVGPRVAYLFSDTGALRPFAMAAVGFTYAPQQDSADARSLALSGFETIVGLGLHWFWVPTFSVDVAGRAGYGLGSGHVDQEYSLGDMTVTSNVPVSGSLLTGGALIGVTGWLP